MQLLNALSPADRISEVVLDEDVDPFDESPIEQSLVLSESWVKEIGERVQSMIRDKADWRAWMQLRRDIGIFMKAESYEYPLIQSQYHYTHDLEALLSAVLNKALFQYLRHVAKHGVVAADGWAILFIVGLSMTVGVKLTSGCQKTAAEPDGVSLLLVAQNIDIDGRRLEP